MVANAGGYGPTCAVVPNDMQPAFIRCPATPSQLQLHKLCCRRLRSGMCCGSSCSLRPGQKWDFDRVNAGGIRAHRGHMPASFQIPSRNGRRGAVGGPVDCKSGGVPVRTGGRYRQ